MKKILEIITSIRMMLHFYYYKHKNGFSFQNYPENGHTLSMYKCFDCDSSYSYRWNFVKPPQRTEGTSGSTKGE